MEPSRNSTSGTDQPAMRVEDGAVVETVHRLERRDDDRPLFLLEVADREGHLLHATVYDPDDYT